MKLHPVVNEQAAIALRGRPLVAVDMGFSGTKKSCGVAVAAPSEPPRQTAHHFAAAADVVQTFFRKHGECVLILEAPLSAAFDADGDPCARGEFERADKPRWWNLRAGASMALAALYFCRRLHDLLPDEVSIHLVEGFVVGSDSGAHGDVAERLALAFRGELDAAWPTVVSDGERISIAEWFGQPRGEAYPVILQPRSVRQ